MTLCRLIALSVTGLCVLLSPGPALAQDLGADRQALLNSVREAGYSALLSSFTVLTLDTEFQSSELSIDSSSDRSLSTQTFPIPFDIGIDKDRLDLRIEGLVGYLSGELPVDLFLTNPDRFARAEATYQVFTGGIGIGPSFHLGEGFLLQPLLQGGFGWLDVDADFSGPDADEIRALTSGVLFNTDGFYSSFGWSLALRQVDWEIGTVELKTTARYDFRRTFVVKSDDEVDTRPVNSHWVSLRLDANGLLARLGEVSQLRWLGQLGYRYYFADAADALGFDDYFVGGLGLGIRGVEELIVRELQVYGLAFASDDVLGWGIVVGVEF